MPCQAAATHKAQLINQWSPCLDVACVPPLPPPPPLSEVEVRILCTDSESCLVSTLLCSLCMSSLKSSQKAGISESLVCVPEAECCPWKACLFGWGPKSLLPVLQSSLAVERQVIGWFSVKHPDPDCCTPSGKFPVFLLQDEEDFWYGFPQFGHNGLKIGKFDRENNVVLHPSQLDRRVLPQDEEVNSAVVDSTSYRVLRIPRCCVICSSHCTANVGCFTGSMPFIWHLHFVWHLLVTFTCLLPGIFRSEFHWVGGVY